MRHQWIPKSFESASPRNEAHVTQELGDSNTSTCSPTTTTRTKILKHKSYPSSSQDGRKDPY